MKKDLFILMLLVVLIIMLIILIIINARIKESKNQELQAKLNSALHNLKNANEQFSYLQECYINRVDELEQLRNGLEKVVFTSYYTGDSCKSTDITGSGLKTSDFDVNEMGWYTYNGKVVIAAATWEGIHSNSKWLKDKVPRGFMVYSYYDETTIVVDGKEYEAIVLDTCGASYWDEVYQRIDIFASNFESCVGKVIGFIRR